MMPTTIKVCCEACNREISMYATAYHLTVFKHTGTGYFRFFCAGCHAENTQKADQHVVSLLRSGGVRYSVVQVPAEAREVHHGPPLTVDDLMDFVIDFNKANGDLCELRAKSA